VSRPEDSHAPQAAHATARAAGDVHAGQPLHEGRDRLGRRSIRSPFLLRNATTATFLA
jgi:hypothetical protein